MNIAHITVGVCTYNRKGMLEQALKSLTCLHTNGMIEFEILVVDDASPDDSFSICRSLQACSPVPIRVIKNEINLGVAASRNTCVRNSTGDWIAFFDDDQIAHQDWLVNLYHTALLTGADCVGGPCRLLDAGDGLPQSLRRLLGENPVMQRSLPRGFVLDPRRRQNAMSAAFGTGNVLIRRSLFGRVGMFSESRRRGEDIEFFLRAYKAGASFAVAPNATIYHVIPPQRLAADHLLRASRFGGAMHGQIEVEVLGRVQACWKGVMRFAHLGLVTVPGLLRAYVRRDHADLLGRQCAARFAVAYLCAIVFPQTESNNMSSASSLSSRGQAGSVVSAGKSLLHRIKNRSRVPVPLFKLLHRNEQRFECPICAYQGPFGELKHATGNRKHAYCPQCNALERHRIQYLVLMDLFKVLKCQDMKMLHFAPEKFFKTLFSGRFGQYETADLFEPGVDYKVDIQNLPFEDATYDFVFASHVLEHIPDDKKAIREIRRILRPNGIAILPVPIICENTKEYPEPNPLEHDHVRAPGLDFYERYKE